MNWSAPDKFPILAPGDVHVWLAELLLSEDEYAKAWRLLSSDEVARAERFQFDLHRQRFVASRSIQRRLLGQYLQLEPVEIMFQYGGHGKPSIADCSLQFNASDSENLGLYAFTLQNPIGVDIEYFDQATPGHDLATRFFAPAEVKVLNGLSEDQQLQAFFNGWTRKEAFIKAVGEGLSFPLKDFVITLDPNQAPELVSIRGDKSAAKDWQLINLSPAKDFTAALATKGSISQLCVHEFVVEKLA